MDNNCIANFIFYEWQLNNGNYIPAANGSSIYQMCQITQEELNHLERKARAFCKQESMMTMYNNHFVVGPDHNVDMITIVGLSFLCKHFADVNPKLMNISSEIHSRALDWFFKVDFYKKYSTTIRNAMKGTAPGLDWETAMEYEATKKVDSSLKTPKADCTDTDHVFYGKKVVITGEFEKFSIRNEMAKLLYDCGADINGAISKRTDFVIVGTNAGPKKLEQIEKLGTNVVTEDEFYKIFKI